MDAPRRASSIRLRPPARRALSIAVVALTVVGALAAWWLVRQREHAVGRETRARQLDASAALIESKVSSAKAALAGVPAIVTSSGTVDAQAFESFGEGILEGATAAAVTYGLIIDGADRAAFEAARGIPILDRAADGTLVPAAERDRYCPVVAAVTASGNPSPLDGFDVCSEPERALAVDRATATGEVSVTAPFRSIPSGLPAVSFYRVVPRTGPDGTGDAPPVLASFTTTAEGFLADIAGSLPQRTTARLADGDDVLYGPEEAPAGPARSFTVGGRDWTLQLDDLRFTSHAGSTTLLVLALLLILLLAAVARRTLRYESRLEAVTDAQERDVERTAAVAGLARELSAAEGTADVLAIVRRSAGGPLGTDGIAFAAARRSTPSWTVDGGSAGSTPSSAPDVLDAVAASGSMEVLDADALAERWPEAAGRCGLATVAQVLVVPLPRGAGRGAMAFAWSAPRRIGQGELDTAATIGELVAAALDRSKAIEDSSARAVFETQRAELATALADVTTVEDVARRTLDTLRRVMGVLCGYLATPAGDGPAARIVATLPADAEHPDPNVAVPDARPGSVVRWAVDPVLRALAAREGDGTVDAAEALVLTGDPLPQVLVLAWRGPRPTGIDLDDVADVVSMALTRAAAYEREATTAAALQDALLGVDNAVTAVVHAARYEAAEAPLVVGGDWYDLVADGDRILATVGDVVGRGLSAATVMGQLRSALRAALLADGDVAAALGVVDRFATVMGDECFATIAVTAIDPVTSTLTYGHAGHPPVLIVRHDGTTAFAEGARSWPIGVATGQPRALEAGRTPFGPCDLLVLYTDGLVERRNEDLDVGLERLARAAGANATLPTGMLCDRLLAAAAEPGPAVQDDAVLLAVRRTGAIPGRCFAHVLVPEAASLHPARARLAAWLATVPLVDRERDEIVLAVHEAAANAVEHGRRPAAGAAVRIEAGVADGRLVMAISDSGTWVESSDAPDRQDRGRGLVLMRQLVDQVHIDTSSRGTTVTLSVAVG